MRAHPPRFLIDVTEKLRPSGLDTTDSFPELEDIIESGLTITSVIEEFKNKGASSVEVATLLSKPKALKTKIDIKYVGFEIGNEFVVGYGLDYDGLGRNTGAIYQLK